MIPTAMELILDPSSGLDMEGKFKLFALIHVKRALKQASEDAQLKDEGRYVLGDENWHEKLVIDKESIINAYPLENIK